MTVCVLVWVKNEYCRQYFDIFLVLYALQKSNYFFLIMISHWLAWLLSLYAFDFLVKLMDKIISSLIACNSFYNWLSRFIYWCTFAFKGKKLTKKKRYFIEKTFFWLSLFIETLRSADKEKKLLAQSLLDQNVKHDESPYIVNETILQYMFRFVNFYEALHLSLDQSQQIVSQSMSPIWLIFSQ